MPVDRALYKQVRAIAAHFGRGDLVGDEEATRELRELGPSAVPVLGSFIVDPTKHSDSFVEGAVEALVLTQHPAAVRMLARGLRHKSGWVRARSAAALEGMHIPQAVPPLIDAAADHLVWLPGIPSLAPLDRLVMHFRQHEVSHPIVDALLRVWPHFQKGDLGEVVERPEVVRAAFKSSRAKMFGPENAKLYVRQLRALHGHLK